MEDLIIGLAMLKSRQKMKGREGGLFEGNMLTVATGSSEETPLFSSFSLRSFAGSILALLNGSFRSQVWHGVHDKGALEDEKSLHHHANTTYKRVSCSMSYNLQTLGHISMSSESTN